MVLPKTTTTPITTTPDSDNDTPPFSQPIRQFPFTNGTTAKNRRRQQPPPHAQVTYRECRKNHAANLGGLALDGCGEFMPSASANPNNPASLKCAACGCHRNFHRQEPDEHASHFMPSVNPHFIDFRKPRRPASSPSPPPPPPLPPPPPQHSAILSYSPAPHMLLALSTAAHDDQQVPNHQLAVATPLTPRSAKSGGHNLSGRKRFRTKFTPQQKEKMHSFAESLGWKMQRCNQTSVENFCNEIGVTRGVLKVWMHNNKNTSASKKESGVTNNPSRNAASTNSDGERINAGNNGAIRPHGITGYNMNNRLNDDGDEDDTIESGDHNMGNGIGSSPSS